MTERYQFHFRHILKDGPVLKGGREAAGHTGEPGGLCKGCTHPHRSPQMEKP